MGCSLTGVSEQLHDEEQQTDDDDAADKEQLEQLHSQTVTLHDSRAEQELRKSLPLDSLDK